MHRKEIISIFDQQAPNYDKRWERMSPVSDALYFFLEAIFSSLSKKARILCVGAGTGKEIIFLAKCFPDWKFTVVEPSKGMMQVCQRTMEKEGLTSRCVFHDGYLDTLAVNKKHSAATCFFVSQFILEPEVRTAFFRQIAVRLKPKGILVSSDLVADTSSHNYEELLKLWLKVMSNTDVDEAEITKMKKAYENDVAVLPSQSVATIIASGGFEFPIRFYQAGLIQAFFAQRINEVV